MSDVIEKITAQMSTSAAGFAAVIDGVLNIKTASISANAAAYNALYICGFRVLSNCEDVDCDCKLNLLARVRSDVKIVPVKIEVVNG